MGPMKERIYATIRATSQGRQVLHNQKGMRGYGFGRWALTVIDD